MRCCLSIHEKIAHTRLYEQFFKVHNKDFGSHSIYYERFFRSSVVFNLILKDIKQDRDDLK